MRSLLLLLFTLFFMDTHAQPRYEQYRDRDTKDLVFKGQISFEDLQKEPEFKWFNRGVAAYEPDEAAIKYLRQHLRSYEIVTLIGTWCSDSHALVPKLYKVLKRADYPMKLHILYALDIEKKGPFKEEEKYKIQHVPTIILYKNGEEAGRIVETVSETIEAELSAIIEDFEAE